MELKKYRWAKTYEAGEGELIDLLENKKIDAARWIAEEFEHYEPQVDDADTRIWCAEGSITYTSPSDGKKIPLQAGDALDIPANLFYEADAGFAGAICYQATLIKQ